MAAARRGEPSATMVQSLPLQGGQMPSQLDQTKFKLDVLQGQATANDFYAPQFGEEPPAYSGSYIDLTEKSEEQSTSVVDRAVNIRAFRQYVKYWGDAAVKSGAIQPKFFNSYKFILQVPPPAVGATEAEFNTLIDGIAQAIKKWYVAAQYNGNLGQLAAAIDATKPKYQAIQEGMTNQLLNVATAAPFRPIRPYNETAMFFVVVGLGLAGICLYKACKRA